MKTILKGNQKICIYFFLQLLPRDSTSAGGGEDSIYESARLETEEF